MCFDLPELQYCFAMPQNGIFLYFCRWFQVLNGLIGNPVKIRSYARSCKFMKRLSKYTSLTFCWEDIVSLNKPEDLPDSVFAAFGNKNLGIVEGDVCGSHSQYYVLAAVFLV